MERKKILVVDDHPMMREALKMALADEADMQVIGEASDGREAIQLAAQLAPDVIIMDLLMPGMGGLAKTAANAAGDKNFVMMEAIINSMTRKERANPDLLNGSRKRRITQGSGTTLQDLNRLLKQHKQMQLVMKKMKGGGLTNMLRGMGGRLPPGMGGMGGGMPPGGRFPGF